MERPLAGKAVIITGAGRGIGAAAARGCAAMGAAVVVGDIDGAAAEAVAAAITRAGHRAVAHGADITIWRAAAGLIAHCLDSFGRLDGLLNNAGLFRMARLAEMTEGEVERVLAVNVIGTANCAAHAVKPMTQQGNGSIVNVTSGAQMGIAAMGAYGASKGAVASLTYAWAVELKGTGVRVNALSPRAMTGMTEVANVYRTAHGSAAGSERVPAEANVPAIAYLLSDESAALNGQILRIDGSRLSLLSHPAIMLPVIEREDWTFEQIRDAFATDLSRRQAPLGVVGVRIEG